MTSDFDYSAHYADFRGLQKHVRQHETQFNQPQLATAHSFNRLAIITNVLQDFSQLPREERPTCFETLLVHSALEVIRAANAQDLCLYTLTLCTPPVPPHCKIPATLAEQIATSLTIYNTDPSKCLTGLCRDIFGMGNGTGLYEKWDDGILAASHKPFELCAKGSPIFKPTPTIASQTITPTIHSEESRQAYIEARRAQMALSMARLKARYPVP